MLHTFPHTRTLWQFSYDMAIALCRGILDSSLWRPSVGGASQSSLSRCGVHSMDGGGRAPMLIASMLKPLGAIEMHRSANRGKHVHRLWGGEGQVCAGITLLAREITSRSYSGIAVSLAGSKGRGRPPCCWCDGVSCQTGGMESLRGRDRDRVRLALSTHMGWRLYHSG